MREVYGKWLFTWVVVFALYACTARKEAASQSMVTNTIRDSVISSYRISDDFAGVSIELKKGNRFAFVSWDCMVRTSSKGNWNRVKDTLILNSDYQKDEVSIRLSFKKSAIDDSLRILFPKDASGKEIVFIQVMLNNDSAFNYLMGVDDVVFAQGRIHSVQFDFGNNARTKWYSVPKGFTGDILSYLDIDFQELENYVFMKDEKYLIKGKKLYPIVDDEKAGNAGRKIRSKYYFSKLKL